MNRLKTTHTTGDFIYWTGFILIPFLLAVFAIADASMGWAIAYVCVAAGSALFIEYRFFCTHCPYYCDAAKITNCLLLRRMPKFYRKRPGPLSPLDRFMTVLGFILIVFFPAYWVVQHPILAVPYFLSWMVMGATLWRYECGRCIHFQCPANRVPDNLKGTENRS